MFNNDFYSLIDITDKKIAVINKFYIYGNHLNINGMIDIDNYESMTLVLKNSNTELSFKVNYDGNLFSTSDFINEGIFLDDLPIGKFFMFLKVTFHDDVFYYSLINNTDYNDVSYYTVTRKGKNNLVNICFEFKKKSFLLFDISPVNYECYDVLIDAGHGGIDSGASYQNYNEAMVTLDYALSLKKALEEIGLKVRLTRDSDVFVAPYGYGSRTGLVYESYAKYVFSIHLNSTKEKIDYGGIEIYCPNNASLDFAVSLANSIVSNANVSFSLNKSYRIKDGVYVKTFSKDDINNSVATAIKYGFKPYMLNKDIVYYFMIRETGGIATDAYIDGRNKKFLKNYYYNLNRGAESYLLELGYINDRNDLYNLLYNKDSYIKGIVEAIKKELVKN